MELYLVRHGIAFDRTFYEEDEQRPLTDDGYKKTKKVAQSLYNRGIRAKSIITSPLIRALQTAQILLETGISDNLQECSHLAPQGDLEAWLHWWRTGSYCSQKSTLILVGHEPDLGAWTEMLMWGSVKGVLVVKKAGIVGLEVPTVGDPIGNSELFLLIPPKWLV